jgi:hypothetical protein
MTLSSSSNDKFSSAFWLALRLFCILSIDVNNWKTLLWPCARSGLDRQWLSTQHFWNCNLARLVPRHSPWAYLQTFALVPLIHILTYVTFAWQRSGLQATRILLFSLSCYWFLRSVVLVMWQDGGLASSIVLIFEIGFRSFTVWLCPAVAIHSWPIAVRIQ